MPASVERSAVAAGPATQGENCFCSNRYRQNRRFEFQLGRPRFAASAYIPSLASGPPQCDLRCRRASVPARSAKLASLFLWRSPCVPSLVLITQKRLFPVRWLPKKSWSHQCRPAPKAGCRCARRCCTQPRPNTPRRSKTAIGRADVIRQPILKSAAALPTSGGLFDIAGSCRELKIALRAPAAAQRAKLYHSNRLFECPLGAPPPSLFPITIILRSLDRTGRHSSPLRERSKQGDSAAVAVL